MELLDILGFSLLAAIGCLWYDSLNVCEITLLATRAARTSENLLLLDDTAAIRKIRLGRDDEGTVRIRRIYDFEYSDTGNNRNVGSITLLGSRVLVINLSGIFQSIDNFINVPA